MQNELRMIPLEDLTILPETQCRVRVDQNQIAEYAQRLLEDKQLQFTPVLAFKDEEGRLILGDGAGHRFAAYREAKRKTIPVLVSEAVPDEALADALESGIVNNGMHGAKMSNADKRRAVFLAISNPVINRRHRGDKPIARLCGVSPALVAEVRKNGEDALKPPTERPPKQKRLPKKKTVPVRSHSRTLAEGASGEEAKATDIEVGPSEQAIAQVRDYLDSATIQADDILRMLDTTTRRAVMLPQLPCSLKIEVAGAENKGKTVTLKEVAIGKRGLKDILILTVEDENGQRSN